MYLTKPNLTRDVVTPVTMVLFVVSTVTGVMLLLHWQGGLVHAAHEWLSILFSAVAAWHLARNWRAFTGYLRRRPALVAMAASLAVCVGFTAMTASGGGRGGPPALLRALTSAPLATAAPLFGLTPAEAAGRLHAAGYEAAEGETLAAIGARRGQGGAEVAILLAAGGR